MLDAENAPTSIRNVTVLERVGGSVKILPVNITQSYFYICGLHFCLTFTGFSFRWTNIYIVFYYHMKT